MLGRFFPLLGGDMGIFQTVMRMKSAVYSAMRLPTQVIRRRAEMVLRYVQEKHELEEVRALFNYVQDHFRYMNDPYDIELVKSPEVSDKEITDTGFFVGDCDDASTYLAALLKSSGFQPYFTVAAPIDQDGFDLSHVYVKVYVPQEDVFVTLDVTARGKPFGWEVPARKTEDYAV